MSDDPRGPVRQIVEVKNDRQLILSCGHTAECNPIFHYKQGNDKRCFECGPHGKK